MSINNQDDILTPTSISSTPGIFTTTPNPSDALTTTATSIKIDEAIVSILQQPTMKDSEFTDDQNHYQFVMSIVNEKGIRAVDFFDDLRLDFIYTQAEGSSDLLETRFFNTVFWSRFTVFDKLPLARGSFATIWKCFDTREQKWKALKVSQLIFSAEELACVALFKMRQTDHVLKNDSFYIQQLKNLPTFIVRHLSIDGEELTNEPHSYEQIKFSLQIMPLYNMSLNDLMFSGFFQSNKSKMSRVKYHNHNLSDCTLVESVSFLLETICILRYLRATLPSGHYMHYDFKSDNVLLEKRRESNLPVDIKGYQQYHFMMGLTFQFNTLLKPLLIDFASSDNGFSSSYLENPKNAADHCDIVRIGWMAGMILYYNIFKTTALEDVHFSTAQFLAHPSDLTSFDVQQIENIVFHAGGGEGSVNQSIINDLYFLLRDTQGYNVTKLRNSEKLAHRDNGLPIDLDNLILRHPRLCRPYLVKH